MPDEHSLTSRQADRLRTDVANVESGLEVIMEQVARLTTREERWGSVLMGMPGGSALTIVFDSGLLLDGGVAPGSQQNG